MIMINLNKDYWDKRYEKLEIGWDVGMITTPLKFYFDQIGNKDIKILIPGCGNGYEAEYLYKNKFYNTYVLDYSKRALNNFKKRNVNFPTHNIFEKDFFDLDYKFDLIVEQTFFCALDVSLRTDYVKKMHSLLKKNGKLVGLFFDDKFNNDSPPFGNTKSGYLDLFNNFFNIQIFNECYNSITSRSGNEFFCIASKKNLTNF